jgi:hypothetical protein
MMLEKGAKPESGLVRAVGAAKTQPYPGRLLPPPGDYDQVLAALRAAGAQ